MQSIDPDLYNKMNIRHTVLNRYLVTSIQVKEVRKQRKDEIARILTPASQLQRKLPGAYVHMSKSLKSVVNSRSSTICSSLNLRLEKKFEVLRSLEHSLKSKQEESESDTQLLSLFSEINYLKTHVDSLQAIFNAIQEEQQIYMKSYIESKEFVRYSTEELKNIYRENIRMTHMLESISTVDVSLSEMNASTHYTGRKSPKRKLSLILRRRGLSMTQSNLKKDTKEFRLFTVVKPTRLNEIETLFKQGMSILMKSLGPMKKTQRITKSCKSLGLRNEMIPSWELFSTWPVKKIVTMLEADKGVLKELLNEILYKDESSNESSYTKSICISRRK